MRSTLDKYKLLLHELYIRCCWNQKKYDCDYKWMKMFHAESMLMKYLWPTKVYMCVYLFISCPHNIWDHASPIFFFFFLDKGTKCCQKTHFSKQKHKISQVDITNMTNSYFIWSISHCKTNGKLLVKDLQLDYLHSHQGPVYKHWVGIKWGSKSAYIISYIHITIYESKVPYVPSCLLLTMNTDACISVEK